MFMSARMFGSFVATYVASQSLLDAVSPYTLLNSGLAGCIAGTTTTYLEQQCLRNALRRGPVGGIATSVMSYCSKSLSTDD